MARFTLSRRTVLRGMGGAALSVPPLEIMSRPRTARAAAGIPRRYCHLYGGISVGGYDAPWDYVVPTESGPGTPWTLTRGLAPFAGGSKWKDSRGSYTYASVQAEVGIVSGLTIPWGLTMDGPVPPAGRRPSFHGYTTPPQSAGAKSLDPSNRPPAGFATADQIVADTVSAGAQRRSLALSVQPTSYAGHGVSEISWKKDGGPNVAQISPTLAYQTTFGQAQLAKSDPAAFQVLVSQRKSIIDLVRNDTATLLARLGGEDRRRMQKYLDEVRGLETRIDAFKNGPGCQPPGAIPADPVIGADEVDPVKMMPVYSATASWSNESLRAELITDLVALAFQCDITRVATVQVTDAQCMMNMVHINGDQVDHHGEGHYAGSGLVGMADSFAWHAWVFARLAAKLKEAREVDGSTVLDNTAMCMFFEGGHGSSEPGVADHQPSVYPNTHWAHSTENMVVLYAGRAGGLRPGQHIACNNKRHPGEVVHTCMNAAGASGPLGEITDVIPELGVTKL